MANPEHVEIVKQGAKAIFAFRKKNPDVRIDLFRANLSSAHLSYADLQSADLREADLNNADLNTAHLSHANLSDAHLSDANLSRANLSHANLIRTGLNGANLSGAKLNGANLNGANLSGAFLSGAFLSGADLSGVDLSGAHLKSTSFCDVDLSKAIGLDSIDHQGPSTIGIDALFRSNGKIPEVFLRGCGLPDEFITYVPSFVGNAFEFYSCFISYNHKDKQFACQLHDRLQGKGIRCWLDEKELNPGDDLYHGIDRGIRIWDKVLLCASKHSLKSWWVDNEITIALERERELSKSTKAKPLKIIPLNLDGYMFKDYWKSGHRAMLRKRVAADFTNWKTDADEFDRQFERVVKALKTDGGKLPEPKPKLPK